MIRPGKNIAIKVPQFKWDETVAYYRDRIGLKPVKEFPESIAFAFGEIVLWLDRVATQSQVDVWLEFITDDPDQALETLQRPKRDELEPLGDIKGHWTSDPAGVVLLLRSE
ncbi:hypothetical protein SAMN04515647_0514 [Cohaesibacter sp. ES.047]|uniref:hypothetical protein n=1 Tax=Cohaesibacter sp. ES.047 TaxID=1798205 RepID=UPI000BB84C80|nr:hypothetical protein [Cohaesibacter sp. ES.047]SNY90350.1 hypothetical protein SAMN04515647_0514 [Cohaesibacter sp. ES.047]